MSIVYGIIILSNDWKDKELDESKILWGILTLCLLGTIASLVFSIEAVKKYKTSNPNPQSLDFNPESSSSNLQKE